MQLTNYLERGPLMWMMPLHLHVIKKFDYDDDDDIRTKFVPSASLIHIYPMIQEYIDHIMSASMSV